MAPTMHANQTLLRGAYHFRPVLDVGLVRFPAPHPAAGEWRRSGPLC